MDWKNQRRDFIIILSSICVCVCEWERESPSSHQSADSFLIPPFPPANTHPNTHCTGWFGHNNASPIHSSVIITLHSLRISGLERAGRERTRRNLSKGATYQLRTVSNNTLLNTAFSLVYMEIVINTCNPMIKCFNDAILTINWCRSTPHYNHWGSLKLMHLL